MEYMVVRVVVFVLIVSAMLLSVYFGMKTANDNYKEYQATYVGDDGDVVTKQRVTVTEREEIFSNDIVTCIADFSTGLITVKITNSEFPVRDCYVTNMNCRDFHTPKEFTTKHTSYQIAFETKNMVMRTYDVTDVLLNNKALGRRSSELCEGEAATFLLEKPDQTTRRKR